MAPLLTSSCGKTKLPPGGYETMRRIYSRGRKKACGFALLHQTTSDKVCSAVYCCIIQRPIVILVEMHFVIKTRSSVRAAPSSKNKRCSITQTVSYHLNDQPQSANLSLKMSPGSFGAQFSSLSSPSTPLSIHA